MAPLHQCREIAERAARDAGRDLLRRYRLPLEGLDMKTSAVDLVSDADRAAERIIVDQILDAFPDDAIHGEEGGRIEGTSRRSWLIDPLDGTINWVRRDPHWAVMIAHHHDDEPVLSVVYRPVDDTMFTADPHHGTLINGTSPPPDRFPYAARLEDAIIAGVFDFPRSAFGQRRALGAVGAEACALIEGRLDLVVFDLPALNPWDFEPVKLLANGAGLTGLQHPTDTGEICLLGPEHLVTEWVTRMREDGRIPLLGLAA